MIFIFDFERASSFYPGVLAQEVKQHRQADDQRDDACRQPGADPRRLGTLVAPFLRPRVLGTVKIEAILTDPPRQGLAAITFWRPVVVEVNRLHTRLGRTLQVRFAFGSGHFLGKDRSGTNVAIALAMSRANRQATTVAFATCFLIAEVADHGRASKPLAA
jgi:hypothetical protein